MADTPLSLTSVGGKNLEVNYGLNEHSKNERGRVSAKCTCPPLIHWTNFKAYLNHLFGKQRKSQIFENRRYARNALSTDYYETIERTYFIRQRSPYSNSY